MLGEMTLRGFERHLSTSFRVETSHAEAQDLTLIVAEALPKKLGPGRRDPFSLTFRGPMARGLSQKIHRLAHPEMGAIELFLVPLGPEGDREGTHYQALFC
jgi:hypothetical protein